MSPHEPVRPAPGVPLQAHVEELRRRCEAASRLQGGSTYFREELGIFRTCRTKQDLILAETPAKLNRPPDEEGNIAYFDPERHIAVSDTHRGNLIFMDDGLLAPIDLRVQALSGALLDTVIRLCQ